MTEDNGSLWTACWELFTPAAAPVLRLLRQTFKKVARGPSPLKKKKRKKEKGYCYKQCVQGGGGRGRARVCVFACVSVKPEKSLLSR